MTWRAPYAALTLGLFVSAALAWPGPAAAQSVNPAPPGFVPYVPTPEPVARPTSRPPAPGVAKPVGAPAQPAQALRTVTVSTLPRAHPLQLVPRLPEATAHPQPPAKGTPVASVLAKKEPPTLPPPKWQARAGEALEAALNRMGALAGYRIVWGFDRVPGAGAPRVVDAFSANGDFADAVAALVKAAVPRVHVVMFVGTDASRHVVLVSPFNIAVLPQ